jgi:hypothetical protein
MDGSVGEEKKEKGTRNAIFMFLGENRTDAPVSSINMVF